MNEFNILDKLLEERDMDYKGGLYHETQIRLAYNSNRIEGSSLSEEQTRFMYETGSIFGNQEKAIRTDDIVEMNNHFFLFNRMLDTAKTHLSEDLIKEYHLILKRGTSDERKSWFNVGKYKKLANSIGNIETSPPETVQSHMEELLFRYNALEVKKLDDLIEFHYKFETIHPFQDGNGRVGRIILFKECLANRIMPFIIQEKNKSYYYRGLTEYKREKGYLFSTCSHEQIEYQMRVEYFYPGI